MTTYNAAAVSNASIAHQKVLSIQTGRALRDNPLAQHEGSTDAPYSGLAWTPYDGVTVGDGNDGVFWDFSVDGAGFEIVTPTFDAGFEYRLVIRDLESDSTVEAVSLQLNQSTGPTLTSAKAVTSDSNRMVGFVDILRPHEVVPYVYIGREIVTTTSDAMGGTMISKNLNDSIVSARLTVSADFSRGTVSLYRRRYF